MNIRQQLYLTTSSVALLSSAVAVSEVVYVEDLSGGDHVSVYTAVELTEFRAQLDTYAAKSRLVALKAGGPDEIRFWVSWANFDPDTIGYDTEGYVTSNQGSWICRITYLRREHTPTSGSCKPSTRSADRKALLSNLGELSKLSGKSLDCGVVDGEWMSVDGLYAGQRFTFSSSNPDACQGEASKLVARLLKDVR